MSAFSNYLENKIVNWLKGTQMDAPPTNLYVALFEAAVDEQTPTSNELTLSITGSNSRVAVAVGNWTVTNATTNSTDANISNTNEIVITSSATNTSSKTVTHFGVFDAATAGNLLFHGAIGTPKAIVQYDYVKFNPGAITLTVQ